jgi:TolA-binding protein
MIGDKPILTGRTIMCRLLSITLFAVFLLGCADETDIPAAEIPAQSSDISEEPENSDTELPWLTEEWTHNRRHFKKWREEIQQMHEDFDEIIFDLEANEREETRTEEPEKPQPEKQDTEDR